MAHVGDANPQALIPYGIGDAEPQDTRMTGQNGDSSSGSAKQRISAGLLITFPDAVVTTGGVGDGSAVDRAPRFFMNRPEFHSHLHMAGAVDQATQHVVARLGEDAHSFSQETVRRVQDVEES